MTLDDRLLYARERAGLTLARVKELTGLGESSVSEFENGKREPSLSQLQGLARAYHRSIAFFLEEGELPREVVLWRERPSETAGAVEVEFLRLCQQYHHLEVWSGDRAAASLPFAKNDPERFDYPQAERLAEQFRDHLRLGDRPGQTLLRVLEEVRGVKVFHRDFEPTGPAASTVDDTFGPAVLLNAGNVRWRRNFDLAHEVFHLLTWRLFRSAEESLPVSPSDHEERLADCFASNLLMPREAVYEAVASRSSKNRRLPIGGLFDIAREFDVSTVALLWRMHWLYECKDEAVTRAKISKANALAHLYEEREQAKPPALPARYCALAVRVLRHGDISIGRFAEYMNISRQQAMTYIEQETADDEEVQVTPA